MRRVVVAMLVLAWQSGLQAACTQPRSESVNDLATFFAVPDVTGMGEEEAVVCLKRYGFATQAGGTEESLLPAGFITRTDPRAGSLFHAREVMVTYWRASGGNVVPPVVGMQDDEAVRALEAAGFVPGERQRQPDAAPAGQVLSQQPEPGRVQRLGAPVSLVVAEAMAAPPPPPPPPPPLPPPPSPIPDPGVPPGNTAPAPQQTAGPATQAPTEQAGVDTATDNEPGAERDDSDASGGAPPTTVEEPTPTPTPTPPSIPPTPPPADIVEVPDVTALRFNDASARLQTARLRAVHGEYRYRLRDDGLVVEQSPGGGAQALAGSPVSLVVIRTGPVHAGIATVLAAVLLGAAWWRRWRPWPFHWPPAVVARGRIDPGTASEQAAPEPVAATPTVTVGSRLDEGELRFSELTVTHTEDSDE